MADGLVIKHPQTGAVIFNTETITAHSRAMFNIGPNAGSLDVSAALRGQPFIIQALPLQNMVSVRNVPKITLSGSVVSWDDAGAQLRVMVGSLATRPPSFEGPFNGLVVRRPNRAIQVSNQDNTLLLSAYGAVSLDQPYGNSLTALHGKTITVTGSTPVIAVRGQENTDVHLIAVTNNGNAWSFTFVSSGFFGAGNGLQYWVFDAAEHALLLPTDAALVVKDNMGVKTFDSRTFPLKIVDAYTSMTSTGMVQVPGRIFAGIQSTPGMYDRFMDYGYYGYESMPPDIAIPAPPAEPVRDRPLGAQWSYMGYYAEFPSLTFSSAGGVGFGMSPIEFNSGWQPVTGGANQPSEETFGNAVHTIIDVTGLPSSPFPGAQAITVNVNATSRSVSISSSVPATTQTDAVTVTASGGSGGYSYSWERVAGSTEVIALGAANQASFRTQSVNQPTNTTREAYWRCRVTDASGNTGLSANVAFRHEVMLAATDVIPDPIGTLNPITPTTVNDTAFGSPRRFRITGINQQITLRVTKSHVSSSGNLSRKWLNIRTSMDETNLIQIATLTNDNQSFDFTVVNGAWVEFGIEVATSSGIANSQWNVSVINVTGGGTVITTMGVNATVDSDNNFNIALDHDPDYLTLQNINNATNEPNLSQGADSNLIGFDQPITIRVERYAYSGNLSGASVDVYRGPTAGQWGPWTHMGTINVLAGGLQYIDFQVFPNQRIHYVANASTSSGARSGYWEMAVHNLTRTTTIGYASVSMIVDADNNYNMGSTHPNPMYFSDINTYPQNNGAPFYIGGNSQTVTGLGPTVINVRAILGVGYHHWFADQRWDPFSPENYQASSGFATLYVIRNGQIIGTGRVDGAGAYSGAEKGASVSFTLKDGDTLSFALYVDVQRLGDGRGATILHTAGNIYLDNDTSGIRIAQIYHNNDGRGVQQPYQPGDPGDPGGPIIIG